MERALKRGVEVELILAHPKSEVFQNRFRMISRFQDQDPPQDWPEWISEWKRDYKKLRLIPTYSLFPGPFVIVDGMFYLGLFSPIEESDLAPLFEISAKTKTGQTLDNNIEQWRKSLESQL